MITVSEFKGKLAEENEVEMVERKGLGHPDSLCDGIAEEISRRLCREYEKRYNIILHHNVDKVLLSAGETLPKFGGGEIIEPITIVLAGRATKEFEGEKVPVDEIAIDATKDYLKKILPNLNVEDGVIIEPRIRQGSVDLRSLFSKEILANDTSFGIGYAPLSKLEKAVLNLEKYLNSSDFKREHPELGADIKVMGLRIKDKIRITVAGAFISKHISDIFDYKEKKEKILEKINKFLEKELENQTSVDFNTADNYEEGSVYLTISGTSAECGDDGEVGRGNRANGLITPNRPMSLEACAGKNPKTHTGKIYNILSFQIADRIYNELGIKEVYVKILSQIGKPITQPQVLSIKLTPFSEEIEDKAIKIAKEELENLPEITRKIVEGKIKVF